jgi:hypothetical protein
MIVKLAIMVRFQLASNNAAGIKQRGGPESELNKVISFSRPCEGVHIDEYP